MTSRNGEYRISRLAYGGHRIYARLRTLGVNLARNISASDFSIIGAYNTGNIGDLAMGLTLKRIAKNEGMTARLDFLGATKFAPKPRLAVMGGGELGNATYYDHFRDWLDGRSDNGAIIGVNTAIDIEESPTSLIDFLRGVRFISQRTHQATRVLSDLLGRHVFYQPDITFAMPRVFPEVLSTDSRQPGTVGISICPLYMTIHNQSRLVASTEQSALFTKYNPEFGKYLPIIGSRYAETVSALADILLSHGQRLVHIPFSPVDDLFARSIFGKKNVEFVSYRSDPLKMLRAISRCEKLYATRFHSHIFGLISRVPTVSIAYSAKCETLWADLGLAGTTQVSRMDVARDPLGTAEILGQMEGSLLNEDTLAEIVRESHKISRMGLLSLGGLDVAEQA